MSKNKLTNKTLTIEDKIKLGIHVPLNEMIKYRDSFEAEEHVVSASSGLRINGSKATDKFEPSGDLRAMIDEVLTGSVSIKNSFFMRIRARFMSDKEFMRKHSSGTLSKNRRNGFDYKKQLLHERIAFDFGYGFEAIHESHVNWGIPITEGDCHAITEAGWHIDRYQFIAFPGDEFEAKYLKIHTGNGPDREGVGIIVRKTSAPYIPASYVVFSVIAEVDVKTHEYMSAINPC